MTIPGEEPGFRYQPLVKLASGGMATVYIGALRGPSGFRQIVAIKRPHAHLLDHAETREAALAEARIAARFHHANVVDVRDVEVAGEQIQLIMDYVEGVPFSALLADFARRGERVPAPIALRIALDAGAGLAAVHELTDDDGTPLHVVHRDISPQNILVGTDGVARVTDFGTVKEPSSGRPLTTQGTLKGKPGYMAPEYVQRGTLDHRADQLALAVVLWEALAGRRLFRGATDFETFEMVLRQKPPAPSHEVAALGSAFDEPLGRALAKDPAERYPTVRAFVQALERSGAKVATHAEVGDLVTHVAGAEIRARRTELAARLEALDAAPTSARAFRQSDAAIARAPMSSAPLDAPGDAASATPGASPFEARSDTASTTPASATTRTSAAMTVQRRGSPAMRAAVWAGAALALVAIAALGGARAWLREPAPDDHARGATATLSSSIAPEDAPSAATTTAAAPSSSALATPTAPAATGALAPSSSPSPSLPAAPATSPTSLSQSTKPRTPPQPTASTSAAPPAKRGPRPPPPNPY